MVSKNYRQNQKEVMELYHEFVSACQMADRNVAESICKQADKIQNRIFNLMILGEAKSGKSTFINAYLGREVVPMDVRQCTSAIIKIHRGDCFHLTAKTAGGGRIEIDGDEQIREFLKAHAALSDKYRNIPITTIDNEILIKYQGEKVSPAELDRFLKELEKDNISNIDGQEYKNQIKAYISDNASSWDKIVTEMDITYPLPEEMQGITIIDSPGVGAAGNVGQITEDYINEADAIIFVKSLRGQAIESQSFINFLRSNCREKKKGALILVFTGKADLQGAEFNRIKEQALEMYKNDINPERILFVDSKVQLFLNHCYELKTEEKIDAFFNDLDAAHNDYSPVSLCWAKSRGSMAAFEEKMNELSNFNCVREALEKFGRAAYYLQMLKFIENLEKESARYKEMFEGALVTGEKNVRDPALLEDSIRIKKNEIAETYNKMTEGIFSIQKRYIDRLDGEMLVIKEAERRRDDYREKLNRFRTLEENEIKDTTFNEMKKITMDAIDDTVQFRRDIAQRVIDECNEKLIQYTSDPYKIPAEAFAPNFTAADFDKIDKEAKEQTSGYYNVEKGFSFFKSTSRAPFHHLRKHVKIVADSIDRRLGDEIIPKMVDNAVSYVQKCTDIYLEKLTEHKAELEKEYNDLLVIKDDNDKLCARIRELRGKVVNFSAVLERIGDLQGGLKNYVGKQ